MVTPTALGGRKDELRRRRDVDACTDGEKLAEYASDDSKIVRLGVARNPHTPGPVLAMLVRDPKENVMAAALSNPSLPVTTRYEFAETTTNLGLLDFAMRGAPDAHRDALAERVTARHNELRQARKKARAAEHEAARQRKENRPAARKSPLLRSKESTSPDELDGLSQSQERTVRVNVARNPKSSEYTLRRLVSDPQRLVRNAVALNPNLPASARRRLMMTETDPDLISNIVYAAPEREREELLALALKSPRADIRTVAKVHSDKLRKKAASASQQRPSEEAQKKAVACPTPDKRRYSSKGNAAGEAANASRSYDGKPFRVYPCPAGHWHLTSKVRKVKKKPS